MASRTRRHTAAPKIGKDKRRLDWQGQAAYDDWLSICVKGTPEIFRFAGSLLYDEATSIPSLPTDHEDLDNKLAHANSEKQQAMITVALQLLGMEKNCPEDTVMICDNDSLGEFKAFMTVQDPETGLFLCNGQSFYRPAHPEFFAMAEAANSEHGAVWDIQYWTSDPDEDELFLPDLTGRRAIVGVSPNHATHKAGGYGGTDEVTLTTLQIPAHSHQQRRWVGGGALTKEPSAVTVNNASDSATGATLPTTGNTGGGGAHENMSPYMGAYWHVRVEPFCFEVPVIVGRPGEPGEPGDCGDCGDNPPSVPDITDPGELPPFEEGQEPADIPCSAAFRMVSVMKESLDELISEAESAVNITFFLLAVITTIIGSFIAGVGISFLRNLYTLVKDETEFDEEFWDTVRCIAYGLLPPDGLFNDEIITALWHALEDHGNTEDDPRFNVLSGFIRVLQYNGINYLSRVDPIPEADCTDCDPPDPTNLGSFDVFGRTSGYTSSPFNTVGGKLYKVVVVGSARIYALNSGWRKDAQWLTQNNFASVTRENVIQFSDGSRPNAIDPTYNGSHIYEFWRTGTGAPIALRMFDSNYTDNHQLDKFTVTVWEY